MERSPDHDLSTPATDTVVVVLGGGPLTVPAGYAGAASVIAADSGFDEALAAGLIPDVVVGDLDSISPDGLDRARSDATTIDAHPHDKDDTDGALALARAASSGHRHLVVLGAEHTDRLDHRLGTIGALGHPTLAAFDSIAAFFGATELRVVHPGRRAVLRLDPQRTFSVIAAHGPCRGVTIAGARWTLDDADLSPEHPRGVSNMSLPDPHSPVVVSVAVGVVTVVIPPSRHPTPAAHPPHPIEESS